MLNTVRLLAIATVLAAFAPSAFAEYLPPHDRDSEFIDSGHYINGEVAPASNYSPPSAEG